MPCKAKEVKMSEAVRAALTRIVNKSKIPAHYMERGKIVLYASDGHSNTEIAEKVGMSAASCGKWRNRFIEKLPRLEVIADGDPECLEEAVLGELDDEPRCGRPAIFTVEEILHIILMACQKPAEYGVEATHWTAPLLTETIIKEGIVPSISESSVRRILKNVSIKPWIVRYWLNSADKIKDRELWTEIVRKICELYLEAPNLAAEGHHVVSGDEMTGIQALERKYPELLCMPGSPCKIEFEYKRHGTVSLIGFLEVATGRLYSPFLKRTRTSQDFVEALTGVIDTDPDGKWTIILDGLNTHKSAELVYFVAERCGITEDLGKKGKKGILKNMKTRAEFLSNPDHRINIVYTPRHSSWVNQIEIWFSGLSRRLLRSRNYKSVDDLCDSIRRYAEQKNENAQPINWTYKGLENAA